MDPTRFDRLSRALATHSQRRRVLGLLAALPLAGALGGLLGPEGADGQGSGAGVGGGGGRRHRRRRHTRDHGDDKCNKKCGPCKRCKDGTCTKKQDGTVCQGDGTCTNGRCTKPSCTDGIQNQGESDIDCGGPCPRCDNGRTCASRDDCATAFCKDGTCQNCPVDESCGEGSTNCSCSVNVCYSDVPPWTALCRVP